MIDRQTFVGERLLLLRVQLCALAGKTSSLESLKLLCHRDLDRLATIRKAGGFDELIDTVDEFAIQGDGDLGLCHGMIIYHTDYSGAMGVLTRRWADLVDDAIPGASLLAEYLFNEHACFRSCRIRF